MPSSHSVAHKKGGVKHHATSPTPSNNAPLPRLKLKVRQPSPVASSSTSTIRKSRPPAPPSRPLKKSSKAFYSDDSSSDLTPPEDEDEDDDDNAHEMDFDQDVHEAEDLDLDVDVDEDEDDADFDQTIFTPRKGVHKGRNNTPTQTSSAVAPPRKLNEKGKSKLSATGKGKDVKKSNIHKDAKGKVQAVGQNASAAVVPNHRDKKRATKLEEVERRRARDAKFEMEGIFGSAAAPTPTPTSAYSNQDDGASSYGDDESDDNMTEDDFTGVPEALMGHEIEDLNYGAGHDADVEKQPMAYWDETSSDEEEEEMYINQLSGSELEQLSQSSVGEDTDETMSDSDFSSSSDDGLDEFGFPIPSASLFPIDEENTEADPGLVLMENWDGQFVLVQPRQERSRSRHRGEKGSRTAGSVSGSTNVSGTDQQGLIIDADAGEGEFYDSDDSCWSGMSDEDDGGDTTDSMAEEDMPMLDSPALNELMEAQMAEAVLRMAVENGEMPMLDPVPVPTRAQVQAQGYAPSIVVTDIGGLDVHTPALSTTSSSGPAPGPTSATLPQTPAPAAPLTHPGPTPALAPVGPVMGTFHPATGDPAQHAVIDGSGADTKSPFTHRRRSRRGRDAASVASSKRSQEEKKRKQSTTDPFSPAPSHAVFGLTKKARYSSIPGHPRYVAARRAAEALCDPQDRETTPSDSDPDAFSLEDMLETSVLMHELEEQGHGHEEELDDPDHLRHMIRFDRVGVSTYLRRNFGATSSSGNIGGGDLHHANAGLGLGLGHGHGNLVSASPNDRGMGGMGMGLGMGMGMGMGALEDTLVGPLGGGARMLISPVLAPTHGQGQDSHSRKEKRRRRKAAAASATAASTAAAAGVLPITSSTASSDPSSNPTPNGVMNVVGAGASMPDVGDAGLIGMEEAPMPVLTI